MYDTREAEEVDLLLSQLKQLEQELRTEIDGLRTNYGQGAADQNALGNLPAEEPSLHPVISPASLRRCEQRLEQVHDVLHRIADSQHYGYCERCDEPINIACLRSTSESSFCRECQRLTEQP